MLRIMKFFILLLICCSCINLKSTYPEIQYYRLSQEPLTLKNLGKINATLMIRDFVSSGELDTEHLIALWDNTRLQKYYYHRWLTDVSALMTDFFY